MLVVESGNYEVWSGGKMLCFLDVRDGLYFTRTSDGIILRTLTNSLGKFPSIRLRSANPKSSFRVRTLAPSQKERIYPDNLEIKIGRNGLSLINITSLDNYVAGVVEAESGRGNHLEFYKVQAVICRTYSLQIKGKYRAEGFDVCDKVECQVYHGMARYEPLIQEAVKATTGLVLVDQNARLITAVFHSNSGGQTVGSAAVWGKALPYLRAKEDPYSIGQPHYNWERIVSKADWLKYLGTKFAYPVSDSTKLEAVLNLCPDVREEYLDAKQRNAPLKAIRMDWGLRSTFFELEAREDSIIIQGRGFGHGVGLSQEGAMRMAILGFNYQNIIHFYYHRVVLVRQDMLPFFQAP